MRKECEIMAEIDIKTLNDSALKNPSALITAAENRYHEKIAELATLAVEHTDLRAILLAGPSGSGKTTTANLLADAIKQRREDAIVLSLDDFYKDAADPEYPKCSNGERDFESPCALHLDDVIRTLECITEGKPFLCPKYDFKSASRIEKNVHSAMPDGCVIIEGLHALNPIISEKLPKDKILKLFVSVSTNINDESDRIISGRKLRFIRRMVRDSIYRAADAKRTLDMWHGVIAGEDMYLYPYKYTADVAFDTFHDFELGVMKHRASALLDEVLNPDEFVETVRGALSAAEPISDALVPTNSLIREFISGGIYHEIYG